MSSLPDPISQIEAIVDSSQKERKALDKQLGSTIVMDKSFLLLAGAVLVVALCLVLEHSQGVRGLEALLYTDVAKAQQTTIASRIFLILSSVGVIGLGAATLITQKWVVACIAWAVSSISLVYGFLAMWLRQSARGANPDAEVFGGPAVGMYMAWFGVAVAVVALTTMVWKKSSAHQDLEKQLLGRETSTENS